MQELGCCREQCKTMEDKLVLSMKSDMNEKVTECRLVFSLSLFYQGICVSLCAFSVL
jgi:hypothetical protein